MSDLDAASATRLRAWAATWPELTVLRALRPTPPIYLVGGSVRDVLLGQWPKDADLIVPDGVAALAQALAARSHAARVPLHDDPPTERVALRDGRSIDLAAYRGPDLAADLRARDFTINALAIDLTALLDDAAVALIDPTNGRTDLRRGLIRLAGLDALRADPLRLLRAYRLLATLLPPAQGGRWRLAAATAAGIRRSHRGLRRSARERIAAELVRILASSRAGSVMRALTRAGLLPAALPSLVRPDRFERAATPSTGTQGHASSRPPPNETASDTARPHSRSEHRSFVVDRRMAAGRQATLARLTRARRDLPVLVGPDHAVWLTAILAEEFTPDRPRAALLGWLALTLATAVARQLDPPATQALVEATATSLRAGRREHQEAQTIAAVLASNDVLTPPATLADERDRREQLGTLGMAAPGGLLLAWALRRGASAAALRTELDRYRQVIIPLLAAPPLLDGTTVMRELGLPPGPTVGRLLAAVHTAHLRGEIATAEEALALVHTL